MTSRSFTSQAALAGLKDFQQKTVDYVFSRLYGSNGTSRFLVADEVGLGKTLVARGIIAKTLEHLQGKIDRVDVVYICSNAAIAQQNINRLNVEDSNGFSISTRLTYLPKEVRTLRKNKVNFISLTPGTAFDHERSRGGHVQERAILYQMLYLLPWGKKNSRKKLRTGLLNMLQATAGKDNWRAKAKRLSHAELDADLSRAFRRAVLAEKELYSGLKDCCKRFMRYREYRRINKDDSELRYALIGMLRGLLAKVCLDALEPDLVILDEFQRFRYLLDGDDDASVLAKALFEYPDVRVLLLSATPYKMFTLHQEVDEDDHYPDFIHTLNFLYNDKDQVDIVRNLISEHRKALHRIQEGSQNLEYKSRLEEELLKVMCRTERVAVTHDQNAMLSEHQKDAGIIPNDLDHAALADLVARGVGASDPIEYWKSAPYLLSFLKGYDLRRRFDKNAKNLSEDIVRAISKADGHLLRKRNIERYRKIDPGNARMRVLFEETLDKDLWRLLWMPPSMPYSLPEGVYCDKDAITKSLVFSSWTAVPDAVATICSYEAERRMVEGADVKHSELHIKWKQLLRFSKSSLDNRLTGMPVMAWIMPSPTLARCVDPLKIALREGKGSPLSLDMLRNEARKECEVLLSSLPAGRDGVRSDERWYWAAPILLESESGLLQWCHDESNWAVPSTERESGRVFTEHIEFLVQTAQGEIELGPRPSDLADVLADLALAGPGTCALRALSRIAPEMDWTDSQLLSASARVAWGFRTLFNRPETIGMLRGRGDEESYWRLTLKYAMEGNIQAVLDEYVHVLRESLGLQGHSLENAVTGISESIQSALSIRTARIRIDEISAKRQKLRLRDFNTRCRFALRFGDIRDDNNQALVRADSVRDAFNSPFRPFILASTSIGQEGLDFHTWCHAVVHWNLPSNPVDLEQREGRVNRYKGHAIRKNIVEKYGLRALSAWEGEGDPWQELFSIASMNRNGEQSDLVPYWIFEEGQARIERRIPMLPFSREIAKLKWLKEGLALYRLVFGQPRQEDLFPGLGNGDDHEGKGLSEWFISLEPPV